MGHVFTFAIQKGGSGKTASAYNLGPIFAERNAKVLIIDIDPQANATDGLGVDIGSYNYSIYEVLLNPQRGVEFATLTTNWGVDLVPSPGIDLQGANDELAGKIGRELILSKALKQAREQYVYILIDPNPALTLLTINALAAADAILIPVQTHPEIGR